MGAKKFAAVSRDHMAINLRYENRDSESDVKGS